MAYVKVGENESIESALTRFKKKQEEENILKDWREHEFFMKKSLKRHQARTKAKRKMKQRGK